MTPIRVGSPRPSRDPQTHAPTDPSVLALGKTGQHGPKQLTPLAIGRRLRDPTTVTGDTGWLFAVGAGSRDGVPPPSALLEPPPLPTSASCSTRNFLVSLGSSCLFFPYRERRAWGLLSWRRRVLRSKCERREEGREGEGRPFSCSRNPRGLDARPRLHLHRTAGREGRTAASSPPEPPWTRAGLTTFLPSRTASEEAKHGNPSSLGVRREPRARLRLVAQTRRGRRGELWLLHTPYASDPGTGACSPSRQEGITAPAARPQGPSGTGMWLGGL